MKKTKLIIVLFISVLCVSVAVIHIMSNKNPFSKLSVDDIQQIELSDSAEEIVSTGKVEDIQLIFNTLNSMKLKRAFSSRKDGFAAKVTLKLKSGKQTEVLIRSKDIMINDKCYEPDKNYCDEFRNILQQIK